MGYGLWKVIHMDDSRVENELAVFTRFQDPAVGFEKPLGNVGK